MTDTSSDAEIIDPTDFPVAEYVATCRTANCESENVDIEVTAALENPVVTCGVCGQLTELIRI